ncbi:MAG: replication-associated recombination protein A [Succinivibrio sp.]|nr:replication-associated recombination protein A [Succinivibrio sp.]
MSADQTDLFAHFEQEAADKKSEEEKLSSEELAFAPLASRLRPDSISDYIGQTHLLGEGKPLRVILDRGQCYSMILWGPPGVGKTTLALLFAKACNAYFEQIPAVTSGIKDIRDAVDRALLRKKNGRRTLLFVDEVHRFNKSQQDAFLPHIENGTITFIGATTENPSFSLNSALLSRARVYVLQKLSETESAKLIEQALTSEKGLKNEDIHLADGVEKALIDLASGDARHLLNTLEMASDLAAPVKTGGKILTLSMLGAVAGRNMLNYDKGGDAYYELISAFHKSVRGSAPDAALYWYSRILEAGGDPLYVARRLLAIATEDVGLADPRAMTVCLNAWDIFTRVGVAEGERAIAEATVYCALAPKSNHLYEAFGKAREDARNNGTLDVPIYLRNAPTKLMEDMGYKKGYRYAHDYQGAYAAGESFFPEELVGTRYYHPSDRGLEINLSKKCEYLDERDRMEPDKRYPEGFVGKKRTFS